MNLDEYALMASVEDRHWWWCARREILARVLEHFIPSPEGVRILEVGCGTGGNLPMLARFGAVLGAEGEPTAISCYRERHPDQFDILQHSIPDPLPSKFGVIAMFDVLEHIEQDTTALQWVAGHLEPNGIAVLTVPALPLLWSEHDEAAHHKRRYTLPALLAVVPPQLEVVVATYYNSLLFPLVAAARLLIRALPKRLRPRGTNMGLPPAPINWLLHQIFRLEQHLVLRTRLPVGVSILSVLRLRTDLPTVAGEAPPADAIRGS